ncbi:MAG: DUF4013 domain-containing protein [Chloroflexi bacterium]|jgi:hypothetical protein|nr:DUF4013 domain-containing protein [Chloroflexota bacterium]
MDIGKAFTYPFEDKKWVEKVLIGGLLNIIPIVNFIPAGYAVRMLKKKAQGGGDDLPEWDDWGGDWVRGALAYFVAPLIYSLPILLLAIPFSVIMAATRNDSGGLCTTLFVCASSLWGLVVAVVYPAGLIKYSTEGDFGAFFKFSDIFRFIRENLSEYIIALLMILVASIVAGIVGGILCGIGTFWTTFLAYLVGAHLLGQVAWEAKPGSGITTTSYGELTPPDVPSEEGPSL